VVGGHRLPTTDLLGYIIIFESLRAAIGYIESIYMGYMQASLRHM
jgi:hypothetical protein